MGVLTADGGGSTPVKNNKSIVGKVIDLLSPAGYSTPDRSSALLQNKSKPATKVTPLVTKPAQGPYIPGVSNNPAAINSATGANTTTNKTFVPAPTTTGAPGITKANGAVVPVNNIDLNPNVPGTILADTKINSGGRNGVVSDTKAGAAKNGGSAAGNTNVTIVQKPTTPVGGGSNTSLVTNESSGGGSGDTTRPELMSGKDLAKLLGTVYDRGEIEKYMTDAVSKQYANLDTEYGRTQDAYYDAVGGNANMLLDTLKRGDRQAAISGAGAGTQAATSLSALLGISKDNAQGATELAQGRSDLVTKREADLAAAKNTALKTYNDLSTTLGERISSVHNANMVGYTGELGANASLSAAQIAAKAQNYAADQGLAGAQAAANASVQASKNYGGGSTNTALVDPNAQKNQEIANLQGLLSSGTLSADEKQAVINKLNAMMGVSPTYKPIETTGKGLSGAYIQRKDQ